MNRYSVTLHYDLYDNGTLSENQSFLTLIMAKDSGQAISLVTNLFNSLSNVVEDVQSGSTTVSYPNIKVKDCVAVAY